MNTTPEPEDPWDHLHDVDRDPVTPKQMGQRLQDKIPPFTTGETIFWIVFFIGILMGLCVGGYVGCCWYLGLDPWK